MANKMKEKPCLLARPEIADNVVGMDKVPSTAGVEQYVVMQEAFEVNRYQHVCVQPKFLEFSPEELRWKHQSNEDYSA